MHVQKEKVKVKFIVDRFQIVGNMHRYPGARLLDLVNIKESAFLAVTDAEIYSLTDGRLIQKAGFVGLNRDAISFFFPMDADSGQVSQEMA